MRRHALRLACCAAAALAVAAHARPARARDASPQEVAVAQDLVRDALAEQKAGRYPDAIAMLRQAAAIRPTPEAFLHLAECLAAIGALRDALATLEQADAAAGAARDRAAQKAVAAAMAPLRARIPSVTLTVAGDPTGMAVTLDGAPLAAAARAVAISVDPGEHTVRAEAPGQIPFEKQIRVGEGEAGTVVIALAPLPVAAAPLSPGVPKVTWIAGGAALALLAGGAFAFSAAADAAETGRAACSRSATCDPATVDHVRTLDAAALGMWIGAGVGATVAVTWLVADRRHGARAAARGVTLGLGPGSATVAGTY